MTAAAEPAPAAFEPLPEAEALEVLVIGGGVVGLCCAHGLRRAGASVTVLERDRCGSGASSGNAGWIVPSLSAPLAAPGAMRQALRWTLQRDSPVRIGPTLRPSFLAWSWRFLRSSTPARHHAGLRAKLRLGARTMELFDDLRTSGVTFEMHERGLLWAALSSSALAEAEALVAHAERAGYGGAVALYDGAGVRRLEPALGAAVVGGLHLGDERHVRPDSLVRGLVARLRATGAVVREGIEVSALERRGRRWRVVTSEGRVEADRIVVAAGARSGTLLRRMGVHLPIEPTRGCSLTADGRGTRPRHALKLAEARIACSPFAGTVRISGTLEFRGANAALDRKRLDGVIRSARRYLHDWEPDSGGIAWAGLRSSTPDDLPLIGEIPGHDHLFVATGHGSLGLTLAPATAAALVPLVLAGDESAVLAPFRPDRFLRAGGRVRCR
jgi:D-amino-acid dehydrogenase